MNLVTIFQLADARSNYVRNAKPDLIWSAINEAARDLYLWIKKENAGFFIKWDTAKIALVNGTSEYACPDDLEQIVRFSERQSSSEEYREILPSAINQAPFRNNPFGPLIPNSSGLVSDYSYIGPYLKQPDDVANAEKEIYSVRLAPTPTEARQTELIYTAKFIEVTKNGDICVIPLEGRGALLDFAIAGCWQGKDDAKALSYKKTGEEKRAIYLTSVRDRQIQQYDGVRPYLDDLS